MKIFVVAVVSVLVSSYANADSAYPQLTNINTVGNGSSLQSNANMNSNTAISNNEITNKGGTANANSNSSANGNGTGNVTQFDQIRQSPSVFMNAPAPTAPCQATAGGFVSFIAGGGFAASYTLEQCEIRETARIAHGIGEQAMARKILCKAEFAKDLEECRI